MSDLVGIVGIAILAIIAMSVWGVSRRLEVLTDGIEKVLAQLDEDARSRVEQTDRVIDRLDDIRNLVEPNVLDDDETP